MSYQSEFVTDLRDRKCSSLHFYVDESFNDDLNLSNGTRGILTVGGILLCAEKVSEIVKKWRDLKRDMGLPEDAELKYNLPKDSPTRKILEKQGISPFALTNKGLDFLVQMQSSITAIVAIMVDRRRRADRGPETNVLQFYCEGLRFCLQRVAEEAQLLNVSSVFVISDTPPSLGKGDPVYYNSICYGRNVVQEAYKHWYKAGVGGGPRNRNGAGILKDLGFSSSILYTNATYEDVLQVADLSVSGVGKWIKEVLRGHIPRQHIEQVRRFASIFRKRHGKPGFWGDGLVLWPPDKDLWESLKTQIGPFYNYDGDFSAPPESKSAWSEYNSHIESLLAYLEDLPFP